MNLASDMLLTLPKGGIMASLRARSNVTCITYLLTPYALVICIQVF